MLEVKEPQTVNEQHTKLFAVIAHDVKGPIEVMRSAVLHIINNKEEISSHDVDFLLNRFEQELGSVSNLLNNMLMWAKDRQYGSSVHPTEISLHNEAELSFEVLQSYAAQKKIQLLNLVDKDITVYTDKDMLQVILRNLVSNAIKFSYPNTLVIVEATKDTDTIIVNVSDSGIGMNEVIKHKILNNERVNSGFGTAKEKGIGLGLSISKEFIEKLDGKMDISCIPGKGTVICFTLPT